MRAAEKTRCASLGEGRATRTIVDDGATASSITRAVCSTADGDGRGRSTTVSGGVRSSVRVEPRASTRGQTNGSGKAGQTTIIDARSTARVRTGFPARASRDSPLLSRAISARESAGNFPSNFARRSAAPRRVERRGNLRWFEVRTRSNNKASICWFGVPSGTAFEESVVVCGRWSVHSAFCPKFESDARGFSVGLRLSA